MQGQISWNTQKSKYELKLKNKVIVRSNRAEYLTWIIQKQNNKKVTAAKITDAVIISSKPSDFAVTSPSGTTLVATTPDLPRFTIEERFFFMEQLIGMVINKTSKSMIITGAGGVGKTFSVLKCLKNLGKVNQIDLAPNFDDLSIEVEDDEDQMMKKIVAQTSRPKGDYVVVKGHASSAALYRILFENRDRLIVFDDCDSVLKDGSSLNLLKGALDSYEDRWISWRTEKAFGDSDLPQTFKFNGSIIFISNKSLDEIDEAVKTRCFKVDLSMTKPQRLARMRSVIDDVMPDVDIKEKLESLDLIDENKDLTEDINFRTLMQVISIRITPGVADWKSLAKFSLTEH